LGELIGSLEMRKEQNDQELEEGGVTATVVTCPHCRNPLSGQSLGPIGKTRFGLMHAKCFEQIVAVAGRRGLPDFRYCLAERPEHGAQCLMIRGHDGPHRALDSDNSEWE